MQPCSVMSEGKLSNPWVNKRKFWTHLPCSFHLINTRNKKDKTQIQPVSLFCSATPGTRRRLTPVTIFRQLPEKLDSKMLPWHYGIFAEAISIAFTSLQQRQSIFLTLIIDKFAITLFLQCLHLCKSRFPILI